MAILAQLALASTILLAGYLCLICATSPNPSPRRTWKQDRVGIIVDPRMLVLCRAAAAAFVLYHAFLVIFIDRLSPGCRAKLNDQVFHWNWYTATWLFLIICVGAPLRMSAFAGLGGNFTFELAAPDRLTTGGLYRYIQHPSYTGLAIMGLANLALFDRWDAAPACLMPEGLLACLEGYGPVASGFFLLFVARKMMVRVKDEEAMLRDTFGAEWEKWHQSTKRFIPGLF